MQAVAGGTADFGYADVASMIKAATQGAPVITTGVLLQKSPMAMIGLTERNIRSPADMRGKTVALTPGRLGLAGMAAAVEEDGPPGR